MGAGGLLPTSRGVPEVPWLAGREFARQRRPRRRSEPSCPQHLLCVRCRAHRWRGGRACWVGQPCEHPRQGARVPRADNRHGVGPGRPVRREARRDGRSEPEPPEPQGGLRTPGCELARVTGEVWVTKQVLEALRDGVVVRLRGREHSLLRGCPCALQVGRRRDAL